MDDEQTSFLIRLIKPLSVLAALASLRGQSPRHSAITELLQDRR